MMSTGTTYYETKAELLQANIDAYQGSLFYWQREEAHYGEHADACRAAAAGIDTNTDPLGSVLAPVWGLHTTHTWEGGAATRSRNRLDIHSGRTTGAITALRALADDLRAEAENAQNRANSAGSEVGRYRTLILDSQDDLRAEAESARKLANERRQALLSISRDDL